MLLFVPRDVNLLLVIYFIYNYSVYTDESNSIKYILFVYYINNP